jgi:hypothetical protein
VPVDQLQSSILLFSTDNRPGNANLGQNPLQRVRLLIRVSSPVLGVLFG